MEFPPSLMMFQILQQAGISSTYAYSGLDPSARKIALGRFTNNKCSVLIVTDVAARGLDLPALDTVINYNFPAKPKLFVHRVGMYESKLSCPFKVKVNIIHSV
jgi:ATP-dependent RNA helicase DDX54/DBP10